MLEVGIFPKFEVSEMLPKTHQMSGKKILSQRFFYSIKLASLQAALPRFSFFLEADELLKVIQSDLLS